jgi:hypothetical protein
MGYKTALVATGSVMTISLFEVFKRLLYLKNRAGKVSSNGIRQVDIPQQSPGRVGIGQVYACKVFWNFRRP